MFEQSTSRRGSNLSRMSSHFCLTPNSEIINMTRTCSDQLHLCLARVRGDQIVPDELLITLRDTATVMETIFLGRTKRSMTQPDEDEEDIHSLASNSSLHESIQEWISTTFSRRNSVTKQPRKRLRSLANAIRAGIILHRLFRRMSESIHVLEFSEEVSVFLKNNIHEWNFNIFYLDELTNQHSLKAVVYELMLYYGIINKFCIDVQQLGKFLTAVEDGYSLHKNPYHNLAHGADVTQTVHHLISTSKLSKWLSDLEIFAALFAAMIHDYQHTGTTNNYHIVTSSELAITYNDRSVLENYHVSAIFTLLHCQTECNILSGLSQAEYFEFRSLVINMVLATDMSVHFAQVQAMKDAIPIPENLSRIDILSYVLHAADIGHPAKCWELHEKWTYRLMEEFFRQGDSEKMAGLAPSPLCDRTTTSISQCQIGFIEYIVDPCFQTLNDLLDVISPFLKMALQMQLDSQKVEEIDAKDDNRPRSPTPESRLVEKPWIACIAENQQKWRSKAENDKRNIVEDVIPEEEEEEDQEEEEDDDDVEEEDEKEELEVVTNHSLEVNSNVITTKVILVNDENVVNESDVDDDDELSSRSNQLVVLNHKSEHLLDKSIVKISI